MRRKEPLRKLPWLAKAMRVAKKSLEPAKATSAAAEDPTTHAVQSINQSVPHVKTQCTREEQIIINRLFQTCFDDTHGPSNALILGHWVADGLLVEHIRNGTVRATASVLELVRTIRQCECDPTLDNVSSVVFDATELDDTGTPYLWFWAHSSRYQFQVSRDVGVSFQLLLQNGGVTLSAALAQPVTIENPSRRNVYSFAAQDHNANYLKCLLSVPQLNMGWSMPCEANDCTPLLAALKVMNTDANCARIAALTNDYAINSTVLSHTKTSASTVGEGPKSALWFAVNLSHLDTLRILLLRPSLEMNPPALSVYDALRYKTDYRRRAVGEVFDDVQKTFDILPAFLNDTLYEFCGIPFGLPVCLIIAQYYRMPYPIPPCRSHLYDPNITAAAAAASDSLGGTALHPFLNPKNYT